MALPINKDASRQTEIGNRLHNLENQLQNEKANCELDEKNVGEKQTAITTKQSELQEMVKYVNHYCADAGTAEQEVQEVIAVITQIEVVNRLYTSYVTLINQW